MFFFFFFCFFHITFFFTFFILYSSSYPSSHFLLLYFLLIFLSILLLLLRILHSLSFFLFFFFTFFTYFLLYLLLHNFSLHSSSLRWYLPHIDKGRVSSSSTHEPGWTSLKNRDFSWLLDWLIRPFLLKFFKRLLKNVKVQINMLSSTVSIFVELSSKCPRPWGQGSSGSCLTVVQCQLSIGTAKCFYVVQGWNCKRRLEIDDLWVGSGVICGIVELCWLMTPERHSLFLWQILLLITQSIYPTALTHWEATIGVQMSAHSLIDPCSLLNRYLEWGWTMLDTAAAVCVVTKFGGLFIVSMVTESAFHVVFHCLKLDCFKIGCRGWLQVSSYYKPLTPFPL